MRGPCFHPTLIANRCNKRLIKVLKALVGENIMVSHDRYTIFRATKGVDGTNYDDYKTGERNVHLDLNPWWYYDAAMQAEVVGGLNSLGYESPHDFIKENNYVVQTMGRSVQCILNFADNAADDGGTVLCPRMHKHVEEWCSRVGQYGNNQSLRGNMPWLTFDRFRDAGNDSGKQRQRAPGVPSKAELSQLERDAHERLLGLAQRVPMRAGSVLVWNQLMFHGTSPNSSGQCRYAQYIKAFPRCDEGLTCCTGWDTSSPSYQRHYRRSLALYKELIKSKYFECSSGAKSDVNVDVVELSNGDLNVVNTSLIKQLDSEVICLFGLDYLL